MLHGDLKIGGRGNEGFYDQILPAFANKYAKKWGAKVEGEGDEFSESKLARRKCSGRTQQAYRKPTTNMQRFSAGAFATVHSIDITPAMRESVMQGQVLFQRGDLDTPFKAKPYEQTIRDAKVAFKTASVAQRARSGRTRMETCHYSRAIETIPCRRGRSSA